MPKRPFLASEPVQSTPSPQKIARLDDGLPSVFDDDAFVAFLKKKQSEKDEHLVSLTNEFKSIPKTEMCVFCACAFSPACPGKCSVTRKKWEDNLKSMALEKYRVRWVRRLVRIVRTIGWCLQRCADPDEHFYEGPHVSEYPDGYGTEVEEEEEEE
eukprot:CAMPEP_0180601116 /NCGR_PEP_ID=MMETSP1037_2-20121125/24281_1 /TAXON_ID=632150 /ORGANISM="Azadinium spinosum, Strain 3D9" /LENGTH=155 /DNA_ID=CAMNT_0022619879 /DNA_START=45 /DNA_END=512 /DNA_ORIENTATION=-